MEIKILWGNANTTSIPEILKEHLFFIQKFNFLKYFFHFVPILSSWIIVHTDSHTLLSFIKCVCVCDGQVGGSRKGALSLQSSPIFGPWLGSQNNTGTSPHPGGARLLAAICQAHTRFSFVLPPSTLRSQIPAAALKRATSPTVHPVSLLLPSGSRRE